MRDSDDWGKLTINLPTPSASGNVENDGAVGYGVGYGGALGVDENELVGCTEGGTP